AGGQVQAGAALAPDSSTTNIQEAGVDEPDIVKNDGRRLFTLAQGKLWGVSVEGAPRVLGSLPLENAQQLLLTGNRVIVLGGGFIQPGPAVAHGGAVAVDGGPAPQTNARVTVVD